MGIFEPVHLLIVLVISLVVLGPRRLLRLYDALRRAREEFLLEKRKGEHLGSR